MIPSFAALQTDGKNPTVSNLPRPSVRSSPASSSSGTLRLRLQHREGPPRDTRQALSEELTGLRAGFCTTML